MKIIELNLFHSAQAYEEAVEEALRKCENTWSGLNSRDKELLTELRDALRRKC